MMVATICWAIDEGFWEVSLDEVAGKGEFVGSFDCVVEVVWDLEDVFYVINVEVSKGFN